MDIYAVSGFEDFWPHYARLHASPLTQKLHAVATTTSVSLLALGLVLRQPFVAVLGPIIAYTIDQLAHRMHQRIVTTPSRNPLWHLRAELRMYRLVLSGRMGDEVARVG
jgi:hypothetical protein